MKRIRFIAPVEAIQGNMSGRQTLKYAEHDNPAYDAPKDKRSYARNYRPSYIGAFVTGTGVKYFAVKTKTAVRPTTKSLQAMALQGGAGAMYAALISDQTAQIYQNALAIWESQNARSKVTMRKFYTDIFRSMLARKAARVNASSADGLLTLTIENPWVSSATINVPVSMEVLAKFWDILAEDGLTFSVNGKKGVGINGDFFGDVIESYYNVLGLSKNELNKVTLNNEVVKDAEGNDVTIETAVIADGVYHTA